MTSSVSNTNSLLSYLRPTIEKLQSRLVNAQKEAATGRIADVGLSLGYKTAQSVSLRQQLHQLESLTQTNTGVTATMGATQTALTSVASTAQTFLNALMFAQSDGSGAGQQALQSQARSGLQSLTETLNTSYGGAYIFAGDNSGERPVATYFQTPPSDGQLAVANAFEAAFSMSQSDPNVEYIMPADMQSFLDNSFSGLFDQAAWQATWSSASSQNLEFQVSASLSLSVPTNANDAPYRQLASAFTMVADLGTSDLNQNTFQTVISQAIQLTQEAMQGITDVQAAIGVNQQSLANATASMEAQNGVLTNDINGLEAVDPVKAASNLNEIMTQLETSYTLTGRLQNLSLLNYI
jgi:flagellar hook-associated protein 3 FlgL